MRKNRTVLLLVKVGDFHFKLVIDYGREWAFTKEELEK